MLAEIDEYLNALRALRRQALSALQDADPNAWNWTPTKDDTNSLFVLATHAIGSERGWILEILGGGTKTRNREAEFRAASSDLSALYAEYAQVAAATEALLASQTNETLQTTRFRENYGNVTARWIVLHVIQHYAEHLGQMYLTKQLWEKNQTRG